MRPLPLPEVQFVYSRTARRRSVTRTCLVGACLVLLVSGALALAAAQDPGLRPIALAPHAIVLSVAVAGWLVWLGRGTNIGPCLRIAADGVTWQAGDVKRHVRWDEIRAVDVREDAQGGTVELSIRTSGGWPMVVRGFENMGAMRERIRKGLAPHVPVRVRRQGVDWSNPLIFLWWACVTFLTLTLPIAWLLSG